MHEVLVNRLAGLSLPRKSVVRLTDRPNMTLDVYYGCKTTMQQHQILEELTSTEKGSKYTNSRVASPDKVHILLTLKGPITTAADNIQKYFFIVFQRK